MRDWFSDKRYLALLVLIAVLILFVGSWLRPRRQTAELAISEAERLRLQTLAQQRNLQYFTSYFERVAGSLGVHLVRIKEASATGLVWEGSRVLVPGLPRNHPSQFTLRIENSEFRASPSLVVPRLPISVLESRSARGFQAVNATEASAPKPGAWVLLMTRQEDGSTAFSPGFFSSLATTPCGDHVVKEIVSSIPLDASRLGGGLFDLEGHFFGMMIRCGPRFAVVSTASLHSWLQLASRPEGRLLRHYGLRLSDLDPRAAAHFRSTEGVLVSEVWKGSPAERAGLVPGDIFRRWETVLVRKLEELNPLLPKFSEGVANIEVVRGRRVLTMTLVAVSGGWWSQADSTATWGLPIEPPVPGYLIESAEPGSPAHSLGLRAGDRVMMIDGRTVSRQQATQALKSAHAEKPVYVLVSREDRTLGVLLP
ncbi:MAG: PDZ domain-containing protein [Acidobacteria bacterium]|nr:PDZ domain-containing protein [Acidobacteriota bacterium]